jgi:cobalamin biosynthesis protein CobD/CbiB
MDWEPWLHLAHIAGVVVWVGGGTALAVQGWRLRQSSELALLSDFSHTLSFVGLRLLTPAVVIVLLSGIGMVLAESMDFTTLWIALGIGALVLSFVIGAGFLSRSAIGFERKATSGDLQGARVALGSWLAGYGLVLAILVFAMWDMVFKPGA